MSFEDFYEKSDKENFRYRKSVISTFALSAVVFISLYGLYLIYEDYLADSAKEAARIKHADALCTNLPKPYLFNPVERKKPVSDDNATEIVYRYQTERDADVIIPEFLQWFNSNGWKRRSNDELIFTKGEQTIALRSDDNFFTHYDIHCYEEEISFGLYDLSN